MKFLLRQGDEKYFEHAYQEEVYRSTTESYIVLPNWTREEAVRELVIKCTEYYAQSGIRIVSTGEPDFSIPPAGIRNLATDTYDPAEAFKMDMRLGEVRYVTEEINSLEDLLAVIENAGHSVIVNYKRNYGYELPDLLVYDDYIE